MRSDTCMKRSRFGEAKAGLLVGALSACLAMAGCHDRNPGKAVPGDRDDHRPWNGIAAGERIRITGTEPFWSAEIRGDLLTYSTPDLPTGEHGEVTRFAGRGGVSYSGEFPASGEGQAKAFTLAIEPGPCSDGMSDRRYPFTAVFKIGEDLRKGCAWTDRHPATGPA